MGKKEDSDLVDTSLEFVKGGTILGVGGLMQGQLGAMGAPPAVIAGTTRGLTTMSRWMSPMATAKMGTHTIGMLEKMLPKKYRR